MRTIGIFLDRIVIVKLWSNHLCCNDEHVASSDAAQSDPDQQHHVRIEPYFPDLFGFEEPDIETFLNQVTVATLI